MTKKGKVFLILGVVLLLLAGAFCYLYFFTNLLCSHTYGEWKTTIAATCEADGSRKMVCTKCGDTVKETIPATGHKEVTDPAVDSNCTATGLTAGSHCSVCNAVLIEQKLVEAFGHDFSTAVVIREPDCTNTGVIAQTCSRCQYTENEEIPANGHSFSKATCTESRVCSVCNAIGGLALGHDYKKETLKQATCTNAGSVTYSCSRCGKSYSETSRALGHDYKKEVVSKASCTEAGEITYTCTRCGKKYTETEKALGHSYSSTVTRYELTTCTENGKIAKTCTRCGYSVTETEKAYGHNYVDGKCTRCGKKCIELNFKFDLPLTIDNWSDPKYWKTQTVVINSITYTATEDSIVMTLSGEKTFQDFVTSSRVAINYKLYDEGNYVVSSGTIKTESIAKGDKFSQKATIRGLTEGKTYYLTLSDVAW